MSHLNLFHAQYLVWCLDSSKHPVCGELVKMLHGLPVRAVVCTGLSGLMREVISGEKPDLLFIHADLLPDRYDVKGIPVIGIPMHGKPSTRKDVLPEEMITPENLRCLFL